VSNLAVTTSEKWKRHDAPVFRRVAEALRPRRPARPSSWAEGNIRLTSKMGAEQSGPYSCEFYPWLRAFHDCLYDRPDKLGVIAPKPSQNGLTLAMLNIMASLCATMEGRILYLIGKEESADDMVNSRWLEIEKVPALAERFRRGSEESARNVMKARVFEGGQINFVTARSAPNVSTFTYPVLVLDELDQAMRAFPAQFGDLLTFATGRQTAIRGPKQLWAFSHPTDANVGIMRLWRLETDRGRWVFDCPHCHNPADLNHRCIKFRGVTLLDEPDYESAVLECPRCGREITDTQRRRATWGPEKGGSGRRWTDMDAGEAARRDYLGFSINGLMNPHLPLRHFAKLLVTARREGEQTQRSVVNVHFGEGFKAAGEAVDPDALKKSIHRGTLIGGRVGVPGGRLGVRFVTVGLDVQQASTAVSRFDDDGQAVLLFYLAAVAWAATGTGYVFALERVLGWPALYEIVRQLAVVIQPGGRDEGLVVPVSAVGIDSGFQTQAVLDHCRMDGVPFYSPIDQRHIPWIPVQYEPSLKADRPVVMPSMEKRLHPTKPELGAIDRYYLHRHTFVNRMMMRWQAGRLVVLCDVPEDFQSHLTANVLRPVKKLHNLEPEKKEWERPDEYRDDWGQALAFAEAIAAIHCRLDAIDQLPALDDAGGGQMTIAAPTIAGIQGRQIYRR
jgi:phage terminase large subunit GpA-like protein